MLVNGRVGGQRHVRLNRLGAREQQGEQPGEIARAFSLNRSSVAGAGGRTGAKRGAAVMAGHEKQVACQLIVTRNAHAVRRVLRPFTPAGAGKSCRGQ